MKKFYNINTVVISDLEIKCYLLLYGKSAFDLRNAVGERDVDDRMHRP